jgi:ATP-dependent Lon protease
LGDKIDSGVGSATYIAILSDLYNQNLKAGLAVLGNISIGGAIERSNNFTDKVTMLSENGAKTVISPMDNLQEMASIPQSVVGSTDVPFYSNSQMLMQKAILID